MRFKSVQLITGTCVAGRMGEPGKCQVPPSGWLGAQLGAGLGGRGEGRRYVRVFAVLTLGKCPAIFLLIAYCNGRQQQAYRELGGPPSEAGGTGGKQG